MSQLTELTGAFSNITDEEINRTNDDFFSQGEEANPFASMKQEPQEEDEEELPF